MILAVAATEFELAPFTEALGKAFQPSLMCGVGPVESCFRLTRFLEKNCLDISAVINFGVAGAYIDTTAEMPALLDLCLAETDVLGDVGICFPRRIDNLSEEPAAAGHFTFDHGLRSRAGQILRQNSIVALSGNFVTVSCVSGTRERGEIFRRKYNAICENMEGAALARVCADFSLPLLQLRCVSNHVEDRDPAGWRLEQACAEAGKAAALLVEGLQQP